MPNLAASYGLVPPSIKVDSNSTNEILTANAKYINSLSQATDYKTLTYVEDLYKAM